MGAWGGVTDSFSALFSPVSRLECFLVGYDTIFVPVLTISVCLTERAEGTRKAIVVCALLPSKIRTTIIVVGRSPLDKTSWRRVFMLLLFLDNAVLKDVAKRGVLLSPIVVVGPGSLRELAATVVTNSMREIIWCYWADEDFMVDLLRYRGKCGYGRRQ